MNKGPWIILLLKVRKHFDWITINPIFLCFSLAKAQPIKHTFRAEREEAL